MTAPTNIDPPKNMQIIDHGSQIEIVWTWFGVKSLIRAAFALFWDVALIRAYPVVTHTHYM